jgi:hypothetical protein
MRLPSFHISGDTDRIGMRLTRGDGERHVSALLTRTPDGWVLEYTTIGVAHTVALVHARAPWPTALRRALADCEQVLARRM